MAKKNKSLVYSKEEFLNGLYLCISNRFKDSELNHSNMFGNNFKNVDILINTDLPALAYDSEIFFIVHISIEMPNIRSKSKNINSYYERINVNVKLNDYDEETKTQTYIISTDWDNFRTKMRFYVDGDICFTYYRLEKLIKIVLDSMVHEIVLYNRFLIKKWKDIKFLTFDDVGFSSNFNYIFTDKYINKVFPFYNKNKTFSLIPHIMCKSNKNDCDKSIFIGDFDKNIYTIDMFSKDTRTIILKSRSEDTTNSYVISSFGIQTKIGEIIEKILSYYYRLTSDN